MFWTPVVLSGLALVSASQERAIGDVLAGAPSTFAVPHLIRVSFSLFIRVHGYRS